MKKHTGRRTFLKTIGVSGITAGVLAAAMLQSVYCVFSFHAKNFMKHNDGGTNAVGPVTNGFILSKGVKKVDPVESGAPGASLYIPFTLDAGEETTIRVLASWYVPETDLRHGEDGAENEKCDPASGCCTTSAELGATVADPEYVAGKFKPWYRKRFADVKEVASYWRDNYAGLKLKSELFTQAFYASSLPPEVMEAIAANLTILKSPTGKVSSLTKS